MFPSDTVITGTNKHPCTRVHGSTVPRSQKVATTQVLPADEQINSVVHPHNGISLSHKEE